MSLLGVKEEAGSGRDQLESLCQNFLGLRLCVFLSIAVSMCVHADEVLGRGGEKSREGGKMAFLQISSQIFQCTDWPFNTNPNSIVYFLLTVWITKEFLPQTHEFDHLKCATQ